MVALSSLVTTLIRCKQVAHHGILSRLVLIAAVVYDSVEPTDVWAILMPYAFLCSFHASLVVFVVGLDRAHGYPVQISLTSLCDSSTTLLLVLLQNADLLQRLNDLAIYTSGCIDVMRRFRATVLLCAVQFP